MTLQVIQGGGDGSVPRRGKRPPALWRELFDAANELVHEADRTAARDRVLDALDAITLAEGPWSPRRRLTSPAERLQDAFRAYGHEGVQGFLAGVPRDRRRDLSRGIARLRAAGRLGPEEHVALMEAIDSYGVERDGGAT